MKLNSHWKRYNGVKKTKSGLWGGEKRTKQKIINTYIDEKSGCKVKVLESFPEKQTYHSYPVRIYSGD